MREIFANHPHWQQVLSIVERLNTNGYAAYLAGGAVRDALLGLPVHDFDIATDARPDDLEKLFPDALDIGKQFGIMMIPFRHKDTDQAAGHRIEIATFRADGAYLDGRHPESVRFAAPQEDAKRRDFTVNALFYDISKDRVLDFVGGLRDLKSHIIRAVGVPAERFREDKLRLLRAVRFSAQLNFRIDDETYSAVSELAAEIKIVSRERVTAELERLAQAKASANGFNQLIDTGLFHAVFSNFRFSENRPSRELFIRALSFLGGIGSLDLILALMLIIEKKHLTKSHLTNFESAEIYFEKLSLSRMSRHRIEFLVRGIDNLRNNTDEALLLLETEDGPLLSELGFALENVGVLPEHTTGPLLNRFLELADEKGQLPKPFLTGHDLIELGTKPGPQFSDILTALYKRQLRGEFKSRNEAVLAAKKLLKI